MKIPASAAPVVRVMKARRSLLSPSSDVMESDVLLAANELDDGVNASTIMLDSARNTGNTREQIILVSVAAIFGFDVIFQTTLK